MSEFTLKPARIRDGKFVPERNATAMTMDWRDLVKRLAPSRTSRGLVILRMIRPGMFVGIRKRGKNIVTFSFDAAGRSRNASHVLKYNPGFEESIIEVFLVDKADWGMRLREFGAA